MQHTKLWLSSPRIWLKGIILSCLLNNFSHAVTPHDAFMQEAQQVAHNELSASGTPSLQIAVGTPSSTILEMAFGLANLEHKIPATTHTKYRTASIAKWFTATAAMQLAATQQLQLDTPIQKYCPEFPEKQWPVTARQLISHTAGIRHYKDYETAISSAETEP